MYSKSLLNSAGTFKNLKTSFSKSVKLALLTSDSQVKLQTLTRPSKRLRQMKTLLILLFEEDVDKNLLIHGIKALNKDLFSALNISI